jgi:mannose-6-phosphate isomerase-like protein (cupin superfamily)
MEIIHRDSCEPFVTKDGSIIRELLAHRNSSIANQSLAEATVPPGVRTQRHHHPKTEEIYYILRGTGIMEIEGQLRQVVPGDAIAIGPGKSHRIENSGTVDLVFLCCCAPGYEHSDTVIDQGSV